MRLGIPDKDKEILAKLIRWLQIEAHFKIETLIQGICSKQTYNKMRKGELIKSDEIYEQLLAVFGYCYTYEETLQDRCEELFEQLCYKFDTFAPDREEALAAGLSELSVYKKSAICALYLEVLQLVQDYYCNGQRDTVRADRLCSILEIMPKPLQELLMDVVFRINWNQHRESVILNGLMDVFDYEHADTINNRMNYIHFLILSQRNYDATLAINVLEKEVNKTQIAGQKLRMFIFKLQMVNNIQSNSLLACRDQLFELLKKEHERLEERQIINALYNLGIYLFYQGHFAEGQKVLTICHENRAYRYKSYILLQGIERKLHRRRLPKIDVDDKLNNENEMIQQLVRYFVDYEQKSLEMHLEDLTTVIRTCLHGHGTEDPFYRIVHDEMLALFDDECARCPEEKENLNLRKYSYLRKFRQLVEIR